MSDIIGLALLALVIVGLWAAWRESRMQKKDFSRWVSESARQRAAFDKKRLEARKRMQEETKK